MRFPYVYIYKDKRKRRGINPDTRKEYSKKDGQYAQVIGKGVVAAIQSAPSMTSFEPQFAHKFLFEDGDSAYDNEFDWDGEVPHL